MYPPKCNICEQPFYDWHDGITKVNYSLYCMSCFNGLQTENELLVNTIQDSLNGIFNRCVCQQGLAEALITSHSNLCKAKTAIARLEQSLIDMSLIGDRVDANGRGNKSP